MGIRHAKAPNPSRLSKTWQSLKHPQNSSIPSKPDRAHICTISGAIQLEYFSEDYAEELEMEPRPERTREITPPLRTRSPRVRRQCERIVGFEEAPNRERSRIRRNVEGNGPSEAGAEENERREINHPPTFGIPLRKERRCPTSTVLLDLSVPNGFVPAHITPYSQPSAGIISRQTPSFLFPAQTGNTSIRGASAYPPQGGSYKILGIHEDQRISGFFHGLKQEKSPLMKLQMIEEITLKGQGNLPRITVGDRGVETGSPSTWDLITDCSLASRKVQERFSPWRK
ncbi:hypothetical protein Tco_0633807 [Tanacetum coccineum]